MNSDATLCRCGHLLDCCADCRDWLVEHSPAIAQVWKTRLEIWQWHLPIAIPATRQAADLAEDYDLRYYLRRP